MIVRLLFKNAMAKPGEVGSDQPLAVTSELRDGPDGVAEVQVTVSGCALQALSERLAGGGTVFHLGEPGCVCTGLGRLP